MPRKLTLATWLAALAAGCAQQPPTPPAAPPGPVPAAAAAEPAPAAPPAAAPGPLAAIPPLTVAGYKKDVASRIAARASNLFTDPLPDMLRSVVVLDITIDRAGNLAHLAVRRSNGIRQLENRAMDSVRKAAPFAAPNWLVRHGDDSVSFLETFLFRDDGRFQIRSLVPEK